MGINYRDYEGDMCGKCIYMDMSDRVNYLSDRYGPVSRFSTK